jgi:hypothetical protein
MDTLQKAVLAAAVIAGAYWLTGQYLDAAPNADHGPGPIQGSLSWGLRPIGNGRWQVSPSIDHGAYWHKTPTLVNVPEGEPWQ